MSDLRRCWTPKSICSEVSQPLERESLGACAAGYPQLGHLMTLLFPYANSQMRAILLKEHVVEDLPEYFMVMFVDQAGWHGG